MALRGRLDVLSRSSMPAVMLVFDDGLVLIGAEKSSVTTQFAFGATGSAIAQARARKANTNVIGELGDLSNIASGNAAMRSNGLHFGIGAITAVDVSKKTLLKAARIEITSSDGTVQRLHFNPRHTPIEEIERALGPLLGSKLHLPA